MAQHQDEEGTMGREEVDAGRVRGGIGRRGGGIGVHVESDESILYERSMIYLLKAKLSVTRHHSDRGQEHGRRCHCKTTMPHEHPDESVGGVQVDSPEGATIRNASLAEPSQKRQDRVRLRTCSVKLRTSHASPLTQINLESTGWTRRSMCVFSAGWPR